MISTSDLLWFIDEALDGMTDIVGELGDQLASRRPELAGANSPYAILTHCLGVMEYWGGEVIADRAIVRDRAAEFTASGAVADLLQRVASARSRLAADLDGFEGFAPPRGPVQTPDGDTPLGRTQGGVLIHIYEELAQHRGQMEVTRDLLLASRS